MTLLYDDPLDLGAGGQRSNSTLGKDPKTILFQEGTQTWISLILKPFRQVSGIDWR